MFDSFNEITNCYKIGASSLSVIDKNDTFASYIKHKLDIPYTFSVIIGQFYNRKNSSDLVGAEYFNVKDYMNIGASVATAIAR